MIKTYKNPCVRCGKERVVGRKWQEKMGTSIIVTTEMICPDEECQKKVNADNKKLRDKYANLKLKSKQRQMARKVAMDAQRQAAVD